MIGRRPGFCRRVTYTFTERKVLEVRGNMDSQAFAARPKNSPDVRLSLNNQIGHDVAVSRSAPAVVSCLSHNKD